MTRFRGIKIDVKDLAASLALPSNNNSKELRFRQTSSCVRGDVRRAVLQRFPYSIYFIVEDYRIVVLAIFPARRDPRIDFSFVERNSGLRRVAGYPLLRAMLSLKFFRLVAEFPDR
jgi:hypothetical protein